MALGHQLWLHLFGNSFENLSNLAISHECQIQLVCPLETFSKVKYNDYKILQIIGQMRCVLLLASCPLQRNATFWQG